MTAVLIFALIILFAGCKMAFADEDYSEDIAAEIRNFLLIDEWHFNFDEEKGVFRFGINIGGKLKHVNYFIQLHDDSFTVYAVSPISADSDNTLAIAAMAEFIARANYGLRSGNFELDCGDGEIRYKIHVNCSDITPSREMIRASIFIPAMMFEKYSPGILDVIFADAKPIDAVNKCEGD